MNNDVPGAEQSVAGAVRLLDKVKDGSVFLGILYGMSFLLLLPIYLQNTNGNVLSVATVVLLLVVSVLIVNFLLNITYYAIIAVPLTAAAILGGSGYFIWLFSPLFIGTLFSMFDAALSSAMFIFGGGGFNFSGIISHMTTFIDRVGQTLMVLAGAIWWFVKKAKDFNHKALSIYLIFLGGLGVMSGLISYSYTIMFLFIWGVVYLKVNGDTENATKEMVNLFKIIATAAIILGTFKAEIIMGAGAIPKIMFNTTDFFKAPGYTLFIQGYTLILSGLILTGIWKPSIITKRLPDPIKEKANKFKDYLLKKTKNIIHI